MAGLAQTNTTELILAEFRGSVYEEGRVMRKEDERADDDNSSLYMDDVVVALMPFCLQVRLPVRVYTLILYGS